MIKYQQDQIFAVCSYPVISIDDCIEAGKRYMSEEQVLERISDSKAKILHKYNPDKLVRPDMPPVFICETDDDRTTLSENSVGFYMAARKAGVSAELHIFRTGGHGYGCGDDFAQTGGVESTFLQSGLRVLELLVKMDIVYEDKR